MVYTKHIHYGIYSALDCIHYSEVAVCYSWTHWVFLLAFSYMYTAPPCLPIRLQLNLPSHKERFCTQKGASLGTAAHSFVDEINQAVAMQAQLHNYFMNKNCSAKIECILLSLSSTARGQSMCEDLELRILCSLIQWLAGLLEGSAQWTKSCACDNSESNTQPHSQLLLYVRMYSLSLCIFPLCLYIRI